MDYIAFGRRIRFFRRERGLTQEQLAELAGLSASFLGHIERGSRVASLDTLMRLCRAMEITPNDLLTDGTAAPLAAWPEKITLSPGELMSSIALLLRTQEKAG